MTSCSRADSRSSSVSVVDTSPVPKASRTKPARRGLKAASPAATRPMASTRSGVEIDLVTYPRAPARMTWTTSSAASETDSARKFRPSMSRQVLATSAPPPPFPPGRCTSRRATSGVSARQAAMAPSTSEASPTTSRSAPEFSSSARTPARTMGWSSMTRMRMVTVSSRWALFLPGYRSAARSEQLRFRGRDA